MGRVPQNQNLNLKSLWLIGRFINCLVDQVLNFLSDSPCRMLIKYNL